MTSVFNIRAALSCDLDAVAALWHESARCADGAPQDIPSVLELRERAAAEVAGGWTLWIADFDQAIAGMLALKKEHSLLDQLYVLPAAQRRGVGRALLEVAMREMPAGFSLRTAAANSSARAFYEHAGLRLVSTGIHPRHAYPVCLYAWQSA